MKRTANFFPIQPLTAVVAAALVVLLAAPLALASRAQAAITEPIPADVGPGPPQIPALPAAGEPAPAAAAIADSITPEGTCGAWYLQSNYAARWTAASTWWEYQCTRSDSHYYTTCTAGACNAFCPECYWESWEWTDYFYWDGSNAVFYGESYSYSLISEGEYWPPSTSSYWWDAPMSQWYLLSQVDAPANVSPTASFMAACSGLTCSFDGSASSDGDGSIVYYSWDFGDNSSEGPLATAEHTYTAPGTYTVTLTVADGQGGWDTTSHLVGVGVDAPPDVPPDTSIESGPSGLTNDSTPTFSFSSTEPGSTFECTVNSGGSGGLMEEAFNSSSVGSFAPCTSPETLAALPDGGYIFEVQAVDAATNTDPTPASRSFTVDTTAPETQIDSGPTGPTNDSTPTFSFSSTEPGSTFECTVNSGGSGGLMEEAFNSSSVGSFAPCTSPETLAALPDGGYVFEVRAIDAAANTDPTPASRSFTVDTTAVDTTAPETQIDSGPSGLTNDSTPTLSFSSTEAGSTFECRLNNSGGGGGGLAEDAFNFASVGSFAPCTSTETLAALPDGSYVFEVRAIDAAVNTDPTPASRSFTVDTTAPETQIDSGPTGPTNDSTPTFSFSSTEPGSTFECKVDNGGGGGGGLAEEAFNSFNSASVGSFAPCTSPETLAALPDGGYVFEVRAVDAAANTDSSPASRIFTVDTTAVDTTAPETRIDSGPSGLTNDSTPTLSFSSTEQGAGFECRLDSSQEADFQPCTSPYTTDPLPDGLHSFEVRARDAAANTDPSPAGASFTIDTAAPDTTIDSGPSGSTNDNTPTFAFSSEQGESFECRLDGDGYAACGSPLTTSPLSDGPHNFDVRATDAVANTDPSPASRSFVVDTTPPDTTIDSGPAAGSTTGDNTPTFTFTSEQGVSFQCRIDGSAFSSCIPPHYEDLDDEEPTVGTPSEGGSFTPLTPLTDGPHTFEVRARDAAANIDPSPASRTFTVDATPPNTSIGSGPSGPTNDTTPSFNFSSGDQNASFACRVDDGAYSACSTPFTTDPLPDGPHTFEVRASDAVGNTDPSPASRSFTVDTTPPETSIDSGPTGPTNDPTPSFTFSSEQGASFECRVDGGVYSPCSSPFTTSPLTNGPHSFEVRARDSVANTDPSPASASFMIDTVAPDTSIDSGPASRSNDTTPTFAFSSSEQGSTFACRLDGAAYVACSSPYTTNPLSSGHHSFEVRATDAAANTDPSPASASFRITRGGPIGQRSTGTTSADTLHPALSPDMKLSGSGKQTVGEPIEIEVTCAEACAVEATGKVVVWAGANLPALARAPREEAKFGLKKVARQLIAGETATVKLMPKSARAGLELKRLVSSGHRAIAGISVKFTDRAGNSRTAKLSIRLHAVVGARHQRTEG